MIDVLLNLGLLTTVACVVLFFWKKEPRYGYYAAALLALVPVSQLLIFLLSPSVDTDTNKLKGAVVALQVIFSMFCAVCALAMYLLAKRLEERQ